ncbi:transmission trait enhancer LetE [Legionella cardiaca]|uniref:Transmission trait enhancer LetE n=1 Tax=Legionella cardiaca TaxID=1071983 RepID=A0ABY8ARW2_9GAMM|nr:transmission trait enhancer LetE [Legionella cardiaca]WED43199.1 transmission trait enhancer LetE [Legionella cardiaca]
MKDINALLPHIKLRFDIEHPNLEECYAYGYECALADIGEETNPYREGSSEYEQWSEGWWAGFYGEKPLYPLAEELLEADEEKEAANDYVYHSLTNIVSPNFLAKMLRITGAIAATAVVGYQVLDLVA